MLWRGFIGSLLVLTGGVVISALPRSAALLDIDLILQSRRHMEGRMLGVAVVIVGVGLLASAFLELLRQIRLRGGQGILDDIDTVRFATVVWAAPLMIAPPLFSRDGWSYAALGVLTRLGISPYDYGPGALQGPITQAVDPRWMDTSTPYGPVPLALGDLAAQFTGNPWLLVVAHRVFALAGLAMLAWAAPRLARWTGANPAVASCLVLASPLMLTNGVGGLHNDLLMVGLMAAGLVLAVERHWVYGAVLGGLAAGIKIPGGLICIAVALVTLPVAATLVQRISRLVQVAVVSLAVVVGLGFLWGLGIGWVEALGVPGVVNTPLSLPTVLGTWTAQVMQFFGSDIYTQSSIDWFRKVASVLSVIGIAIIALRWRTGDRAAAVTCAAALMGLTLALSPVGHIWYYLWLVPFVACLHLTNRSLYALVAFMVLGGLMSPLDSSLGQVRFGVTIGVSTAVTVGALLLFTSSPWRRMMQRRRDRAGEVTA